MNNNPLNFRKKATYHSTPQDLPQFAPITLFILIEIKTQMGLGPIQRGLWP
jgi:hypothetical protein